MNGYVASKWFWCVVTLYLLFLSIRLEQEKKNEQYAETDRMFGRTRVILVGTCILILELCKAGYPSKQYFAFSKTEPKCSIWSKKNMQRLTRQCNC